jgi:hypothetical protein
VLEDAEVIARRDDFDAVAEQRYARIVESRMTIPWYDIRGYLEGRVTGRAGSCPVVRKHPVVSDYGFGRD